MMNREVKKNSKHFQINPNWAQLQQKLKSSAKPSRNSKNSQSETPNSMLRKRKERPTSDSEDAKPNPLIPVNDDFSLTDALAMDCEMVGVGQGNKSALGRVTVVNKWGNVIYDEFVRPIERVVDFRTRISGIRPRDLRKAKDFCTAQKKVAELIKGRILVGHALQNDLKALLLTHPKKDLRDTSEYQPFLKEGRRKALRHLAAEVLGVEIQNGEHCPYGCRHYRPKSKMLKVAGESAKNVVLEGESAKNVVNICVALTLELSWTNLQEVAERMKQLNPDLLIRELWSHSEIDDARAAMLLYQKNRRQWEKSATDQTRLKEKQKKRKQRKKLNPDSNHAPTAS